ncbi:MAG: toprim domain-containing protein [Gammaproteobacteria bacterium]|nr:toprim domain-containing protein [Gammaproteobacteria bacterium]
MIGWPTIAADVARALLGEPSSCTRTELRYGRKGSLSVDVVRGRWHDFETGEGGGVLDLVTRERGSRAAALAWLEAEGFVAQRDPGARAAESRPGRPAVETGNLTGAKSCAAQPARRADSRRFARRIWKQTRPLAGTVAARYLGARGVGHVAGVPALRFHPGLSHPAAPGRFPVLVAGVQDVGGRFAGIQRTYLAPDGPRKAAVDPVRASLGHLIGGAVRLADPVDGRLLVGEGVETTAAAVRVLDWRGAAWATLGTSGLRAVEIPAGVHDVVIAADRDPGGGGQLAAAALAGRLADEGRSVAIELPPFVGDWCDVLALSRGAA